LGLELLCRQFVRLRRIGPHPWGKRTDSVVSALTTRQFTGHEEIPEAGLVNMNARIYDPELGRFMSADSITGDIFSSQTFNRFSYVNNGPLSYTDPTGRCPQCVSAGIGLVVGLGVNLTVQLAAGQGSFQNRLMAVDLSDLAVAGVQGAVVGAVNPVGLVRIVAFNGVAGVLVPGIIFE
jgi:RHS repeat-associated protein